MDEFLKEYAEFRQLLKAAVQGLDEDVVVNLYAVYRKDICRVRMDEKESRTSQGTPATAAQLNLLKRMLNEGTLPKTCIEVLDKLSKQEASELISKFEKRYR